MTFDTKELCAAYVASLGRAKDPEEMLVWDEIRDIISDNPDDAWLLVNDILQVVPDDLLSYAAADILEDFVEEHGAAFFPEITEQARADERFRTALRYINVPLAGEKVWRGINDILREAGVPENELPDWSDYHLPDDLCE
jgi:hypothetical protein